jgi:hypothetical protein
MSQEARFEYSNSGSALAKSCRAETPFTACLGKICSPAASSAIAKTKRE